MDEKRIEAEEARAAAAEREESMARSLARIADNGEDMVQIVEALAGHTRFLGEQLHSLVAAVEAIRVTLDVRMRQ